MKVGYISSLTARPGQDQLWSALLDNDKALDDFVTTNQRRLSETYAVCRAFFLKHEIPFLEANAAFFFWSKSSRRGDCCIALTREIHS